MVSVAVRLKVPIVTEMVALVATNTGLVVIVKVAVFLPGATCTLAGTFALGPEEDTLAWSPFAAATPVSVSVAVALVPPMIDWVDRLKPLRIAGNTVIV